MGRTLWVSGLSESEARLEECRFLARNHGGECLSTTYEGNKAKILWRCSNGHEWKTNSNHIKSGKWCPYCAGKRFWSPGKSHKEAGLEQCQAAAQKQGGECLSTVYMGTVSKLRWRCLEGHEWESTPRDVKHGYWCPFCSKSKIWAPGLHESEARLAVCKSLAIERGGRCASYLYTNSVTKLHWVCSAVPEWDANGRQTQ